MSDATIAAPEPEAVALPTPLSVEPRVAAPAEAAEIARQAEEAKLPKDAAKPVKAEVADKGEKPRSTKEALRAAREKVEAEPASPLKTSEVVKAADPAAKATEGKVEPVATKEQPRAEDGKFTAKVAEPASKADAQVVKVDEAKGSDNKAPASVVKEAPKAALPSHTAEPAPKRFAKEAQERWAEAPDEVRAEVTRMEREFSAGFEKHRAAATRDSEIAEFHERATKGGTTVKAALSAYVGMEDTLRADPVKGFEAIAQNLGIPLKEIAAKILNQAPDAAASQADATITELRNEIADLKKGFGEIHAERTQAKTASTTETVTKFAADHPRFNELADDIAFFLQTRHPGDLAKAYEAAERLNPAPVAKEAPAATHEPAAASTAAAVATVVPLVAPAAAQPRVADKSIAGAPTAGSDPARKQPSSSIKEALKRARAAAG